MVNQKTDVPLQDIIDSLLKKRRFPLKSINIISPNVHTIPLKDFIEIYLALSGTQNWSWVDDQSVSPCQNIFLSLGNIVRDLVIWAFIYFSEFFQIIILSKTKFPMIRFPEIKNILFLRTDHWFNVKAGGSVGHLQGVIEGFRKAGLPTSVISTDYLAGINQKENFYLCEPQYELGRNIPNFPEILYTHQLVKFVEQLWSQLCPSIIYQRYSLGNYTGIVLKHKYHLPFILEYNGSFVWMTQHWGIKKLFHKKLIERIEMLNLKQADLIVTVSKASAEELTEKGINADKILINPNGVNADTYHPLVDGNPIRQKLGLQNKIIVGFIGTFGKWHGAEILAKAIKPVIEKKNNLHFLYIGDGLTLPEVKKIIEETHTYNHVTFVGTVPQKEGPAYLAACDILISPQISNPDGTPFFGSPTKIFEYMAMGKGIIASNIDQINEILKNENNALLVEPGNINQLARDILRLATDPSLRNHLGKTAREDVVANYTWAKHVQKIIKKLQTL